MPSSGEASLFASITSPKSSRSASPITNHFRYKPTTPPFLLLFLRSLRFQSLSPLDTYLRLDLCCVGMTWVACSAVFFHVTGARAVVVQGVGDNGYTTRKTEYLFTGFRHGSLDLLMFLDHRLSSTKRSSISTVEQSAMASQRSERRQSRSLLGIVVSGEREWSRTWVSRLVGGAWRCLWVVQVFEKMSPTPS